MTETMKGAAIRPLTGDDLERVIAIDAAAGGTSRRGFFEKRLAAATERPGDYIYTGLEADGKLVGFALAKLLDGVFGEPGASAALDAIGVDEASRGQGGGHMLLDAVTEVLRRKGVSRLTSQVGWASWSMLGFFRSTGFTPAPRLVLVRGTGELPVAERQEEEPRLEADFSDPGGDDFTALSRDLIPIRSMIAADLDRIVAIDRETTGRDRRAYYERRQHEMLEQSGVRVSLVAEQEGMAAGFIMARVDFGDFGRTGEEAVMDTIGVDPGYQGKGVGQALMSQLMVNLSALQVSTVRTEIDWNNTAMIAYLDAVGFVPAPRFVLTRDL